MAMLRSTATQQIASLRELSTTWFKVTEKVAGRSPGIYKPPVVGDAESRRRSSACTISYPPSAVIWLRGGLVDRHVGVKDGFLERSAPLSRRPVQRSLDGRICAPLIRQVVPRPLATVRSSADQAPLSNQYAAKKFKVCIYISSVKQKSCTESCPQIEAAMKMEAALALGDPEVLKALIQRIPPEDHVRLYLDLYAKQITPSGFRQMDINGDSK
jgi:hypothetical protein